MLEFDIPLFSCQTCFLTFFFVLILQGSKKELPSLLSLNVEPPAELLTGRKEDFGEEKEKREVKLPVALEQALAFKSERAKQIGVNPEDIASVGK